MYVVPIIIGILFFVVWFFISIYAAVYWFTQPKSELKGLKVDWTKKTAWYYGFAFCVFIVLTIIGAGVTLLATIILRSLGV